MNKNTLDEPQASRAQNQADLAASLKQLDDKRTELAATEDETKKLKAEFAHTSRIMLPVHAIIRIEEVEKRGQNMVFDVDERSNVMPFPSFTPSDK